MKQAKKRDLPMLVQLISSSRQAERAMDSAVAHVTASNRRLTKSGKSRLAQLLAEMPEGFPVDRAWENMIPVGLEIIDYGDILAVKQMRELMASAPADISPEVLRALIDEGRD